MNLAISGGKKIFFTLLNFDFDSLERGVMELDFFSKAVLDSTTRVQPIDY